VLALVLLGGVLAILFFASFVLTFAAGLCGGGGGWRVAAWALGAVVYLLLGTRAFLRPRSELWWALPFAAIVGAVAMNLLAVAVPATHGICD
jgi:hypothetical protein